jgi:hypothetical protein
MNSSFQGNITYITNTVRIEGYNKILAYLHHIVNPRIGKICIFFPFWNCFPYDNDEGQRKAKELAFKWSDSFYNRRWNNDFKNAGLWTHFYFDTKNRFLNISVEPKLEIFKTSTPTETIQTNDITQYQENYQEEHEETHEEQYEENYQEEHEEINEETNEENCETQEFDNTQEKYNMPYIPQYYWVMTPYGWTIAPTYNFYPSLY